MFVDVVVQFLVTRTNSLQSKAFQKGKVNLYPPEPARTALKGSVMTVSNLFRPLQPLLLRHLN